MHAYTSVSSARREGWSLVPLRAGEVSPDGRIRPDNHTPLRLRRSRSRRTLPSGRVDCCVSRTWAASAHGVRGLHASGRSYLPAGKQRQALRQSFSETAAVPCPATPHDYRFLQGSARACGVAHFAQPKREIVQARGETRLILKRASMYQAAISIDRLAARLRCGLALARLGKECGPLRELLRRGWQGAYVRQLSEREISRNDNCNAKDGAAGGLKHAAPAVDGDHRVERGGCKAAHDVCPRSGTGADCGLSGSRGLERTV